MLKKRLERYQREMEALNQEEQRLNNSEFNPLGVTSIRRIQIQTRRATIAGIMASIKEEIK